MKLFTKKEKLLPESGTLYSITDGEVIDVIDVKDDIFSQKMLGDGLAFKSISGEIYAPCKGTVSSLFPTKHAIGITMDDGLEILIHIGIDTVKEKGEGFKAYIKEGEKVKLGQKLITFDKEKLSQKGYDLTIPMIITNMEAIDIVNKYENTEVEKKDIVLKYSLK
jgi:glucose-specific phosphotransferase system IIA component